MKSNENLEAKYKPIQLYDVLPNQILGFDIFIYFPANNKYIKYINSNDVIKDEQLQRLKFRKIKNLYIHESQIEEFNKYLSLSIREKLKTAQGEEKKKVIKKAASEILLSVNMISSDENSTAWSNNCVELTKVIVKDISGSKISDVLQKMKELMSDKPTLIDHSLAVCSLGAIIALSLGIHHANTLDEISFSGLLHDIGLSTVSVEIVAKYLMKKEFTVEEYDIFQRHPQEGLKILSKIYKSTSITDNVLKTCLEHHENLSGTGFPRKISGLNISYITKIISIADKLSIEIYNSERVDFGYSVFC